MNQNHSPKISTIIPYYNPPFHYFTEAVESVLAQSHKNWEVIILNDGSKVENKKLLENYIESLNDSRFSITHFEKNYGISYTRNKGVEAAQGDIVLFLDADDLFLPWYFEKVIESFSRNNNCLIVAFNNLILLSASRLKKVYIKDTYLKFLNKKEMFNKLPYLIKSGDVFLPPRITFKKKAFEILSFDSMFHSSDDIDLNFQIMCSDELLDKTIVAPIPGYVYRFYLSTDRLTHKTVLLNKDIRNLRVKYKKKNIPRILKMIKHLESNHNEWRFNDLLNCYFATGSLIKCFKYSLQNFHTLKGKIKSLLILFQTILIVRVLNPLTGISPRLLELIFKKEFLNYNKILKQEYLNYLENISLATTERYYANRLFKRIF
ncbi:MAG: glycosyltransferase [Candidatus Melainabacteria bacterium]|nr:glycosyltransferase [Candidatus Melainabacteria bacterium]